MPTPEYLTRRYELLDGFRRAQQLDALILVSQSSIEGRGYHRYLSNVHLSSRESMAVLTDGRPPIMLVNKKSQQWRVQKESGLVDVRVTPHCGAEAARILTDIGEGLTVGIAGLNDFMKVQDYLHLREALPAASLRDVSAGVDRIMATKGAEELEQMRLSGVAADAGLSAFSAEVAQGRSQLEAVAEADRAVRRHGAYTTLMLINSDERTPFMDTPSDRPFRRGDSVIFSVELEGPHGFWVERAGMFSLGSPPDILRSLHESCVRALRAGAEALRPGATASAVANAIESVIEREGYKVGIWSGHGIGLNVSELFAVSRQDETQLEAGMTVALHPHVQSADGAHSAYVSETFAVSDRGGSTFTTLPHELVVA